jgi:hypothetical protein
MLRRPGDEVGTEEHRVAHGGPECVRATHPIHISVDRQLGGDRVSQEKAQSALHGGEVGLSWIIHVEVDLLDGVGYVGVDERQVLEALVRLLK